MVFNKVDALEEHGMLGALRNEYPEGAFVSALRGIGLEDFKERLLGVMERDFVEQIAYVPVTEATAISHIHRVADVLSEEYMYAQTEEDSMPPQAVARLHFRAARKHVQSLSGLLARYAPLKPLPSS